MAWRPEGTSARGTETTSRVWSRAAAGVHSNGDVYVETTVCVAELVVTVGDSGLSEAVRWTKGVCAWRVHVPGMSRNDEWRRYGPGAICR